MQAIKHYFPVPFVAALTVSTGNSLLQLFQSDGLNLAYLGALIATAPTLGFFAYIYLANTARVSRHLPIQLSLAILGSLISLIYFELSAFLQASLIGLAGTLAYVFWYTPLDRSQSHLKLGAKLASFSLKNSQGELISSKQDSYSLFLFIRGNWCPLCVAQVKELATQYQTLSALNCQIFILSSQPPKENQKLAKQFDMPIQFLHDEDNKTAKLLGIDHIGGTPFGLPGYEANTALPTIIITDPENTIVVLDQTDDYRIRPEPESFIHLLQQAQQTQA